LLSNRSLCRRFYHRAIAEQLLFFGLMNDVKYEGLQFFYDLHENSLKRKEIPNDWSARH
jgi:hypothetical protein